MFFPLLLDECNEAKGGHYDNKRTWLFDQLVAGQGKNVCLAYLVVLEELIGANVPNLRSQRKQIQKPNISSELRITTMKES